jgi:WD40 repeat protein
MLKAPPMQIFHGHQGSVYDVAWHPGLQKWLSAGGDGILALWTDGANDATALAHHSAAFFSVSAWGQDHVVGGNSTGELMWIGQGASRNLTAHEAPIYALHPCDDQTLVSGDGHGVVCLWNITTQGIPILNAKVETGLGKIRHAGPHPLGVLLATGSGAWAVLSLEGAVLESHVVHRRACYWAWWHPQKQAVLSTGQDGELVVTHQGSPLLHLSIHQSAVYRGQVSGDILWTASRDKSIKGWDVQTLEIRARKDLAHTRSVNALALGGRRGDVLVSGSDDKSIKVWGPMDSRHQS